MKSNHVLSVLILPVTIILLLTLNTNLHAITSEEIIRLKEHGVEDKTIQLMIQNDTEKSKQAQTSIQIKETETENIYSTGKPSDTALRQQEQQNLDNAWEMLRNMELEIKR